MAGNLLKGGYVVVTDKEKIVIDNNETIKKRLAELQQRIVKEEVPELIEDDGFVEGIDPVQVALLVGDESSDEGSDFKIIGNEPVEPVDNSKALEEADNIINDANAKAEEIKATAEAQGYDEGYHKGYEEGMKAADAKIEESIAKAKSDADARINETISEYEQLKSQLEPMIVDKLTSIYEHVLGIEFQDKKDIILQILSRSLQNMDSGKSYMIHVSKDDYEEVKTNKESISKGCGILPEDLEIIEDNSVPKNGCLIESELGIFDCGLGTQMSLLKKQLSILSYR